MTAFKIMAMVITNLCYIPGMLLRYAPFKSILNKKQKRTLFLCYVALVFMNIAVMSAFQVFVIDDFETSSWLTKIDFNVLGILGVVINSYIIRGHLKEHLFIHGFVMTCTYIPLSISIFTVVNIPGLMPLTEYVIGTLLFVSLLLAVYYPMKKVLVKTVKPFLVSDTADYWSHVWFIPILMFYSMFFSTPIKENISEFNELISRFLVSFATVFLCYFVAKDHRLLLEKEHLDEQLNMSRVHYASLQSNVDGARRLRHDHKHLLASIRHYIETDNKDGLSKFCDDMEMRENKEVSIPYTGNAAADGIVYHYILRAKKENIDFSYSGNIKSDGIADVDLSVLLGNALDNAFTATHSIEENRRVLLSAQSTKDQLSIVVSNTFDGHMHIDEERIFSRKRVGNKEGVGLLSMKNVCEHYGGMLDVKWEGDTFTVLMILPLT